jgi:hypothetical protein
MFKGDLKAPVGLLPLRADHSVHLKVLLEDFTAVASEVFTAAVSPVVSATVGSRVAVVEAVAKIRPNQPGERIV